jgi:hypothetical protein
MKVIFTIPVSTVSGSYGKNEIVDLDDRRANNYINAGWAEKFISDRRENVETTESKLETEKAVKGLKKK